MLSVFSWLKPLTRLLGISNSIEPTSQQQQIIDQADGPVLIIAGPGSGKTWTLVHRLAALLCVRHVSPANILMATFSKKAAHELEDRIALELAERNLNINLDDMLIGTFHSICQRLLDSYGDLKEGGKHFSLLEQFEQEYFVYQNLGEFENISPIFAQLGTARNRWEKARLLLRWFNRLTEEMVDESRLMASGKPELMALARWHSLYQKLLKREYLRDYASLEASTWELLKNEQVAGALRKQIQYIMVDEYQDTNTIQEKILFKILNARQNICVVGDDDQSLYRFRGATVRNILEFPRHFPAGRCRVFRLEINFRSDPGIINFCNQWISDEDSSIKWKDACRHSKKIVAPLAKKGVTDAVIRVTGSEAAQDWAEQALAFLRVLQSYGLADWNQVAFLFYSVRDKRARYLAQFLESNGIDVYAPRSALYFQRPEIRQMIAVFFYIFEGLYRESQKNWPAGAAAPQECWQYYEACLNELKELLKDSRQKELAAWCQTRINEIKLSESLPYNFSAMFYRLLRFPLFASRLNIAAQKRKERSACNLAMFSGYLNRFEKLYAVNNFMASRLPYWVATLFNHYLRYLLDGAIHEFEDENEICPSGAVSFMTIHQAKGLEFPVTVVGSLDTTPRTQRTELELMLEKDFFARKPFEPQEHIAHYDCKRLFYTAFSRARNLLVLTGQESQRGKNWLPSQFFSKAYHKIPYWQQADFSTLKLDHFKTSAGKQRYSYTSHILLYEGCPRQYQFFKYWDFCPIRAPKRLFGQLLHHTLEDLHRNILHGQTYIDHEKIHKLLHENYRQLAKKENLTLDSTALETVFDQLEHYVAAKKGDWRDTFQAEIEVTLNRCGYILAGKIDLIRKTDAGLVVVDFKSTEKPDPIKGADEIRRYRRQLEIYAYLASRKYKEKITALELYYTASYADPILRFDYDPESVNETIKELDALIGRIEEKDFNISKKPASLCPDCELSAYCGWLESQNLQIA